MNWKHHSQVLISGAGPVGLFAAAELTRRGIDAHIIDQDWRGAGFSYALALHPGSMDLLDELGLADALLPYGQRVNTIAFYEDTTHRFDLDLSRLGSKHPYLTVIPQNWMESVLENWLRERKVRVHWNHRLKEIADETAPIQAVIERWGIDYSGYSVPRKIRVVEKTFPFQADFLLGADGHTSTVRDRIGASYPETSPPELFVVFEFESDADAHNQAAIVLNQGTTSVLWPLPDGRCRWSFQLTDTEEFEGERMKSRLSEIGHWVTPGLKEDRLKSLIAERAPWFKGSIKDLIWSIPVRFERRLASEFGRGPYWLAGDSAHLASPLGIHSMNVGLREARDLAQILEEVLVKGSPRTALDRYALERQAEWGRLLNTSGALQVTDQATPFVRENAERILPCLPASGADLDGLLNQIGLKMSGLVAA